MALVGLRGWRLGVRGDILDLCDLGEMSGLGLRRIGGGGARRRSNSSCGTTVIELGIAVRPVRLPSGIGVGGCRATWRERVEGGKLRMDWDEDELAEQVVE